VIGGSLQGTMIIGPLMVQPAGGEAALLVAFEAQ
jgi:hypothetical protein